MKYKVVLNENEDGISVHCPGLPGCWSQGETESDALDNIANAISEYLTAREATLPAGKVREVEVSV